MGAGWGGIGKVVGALVLALVLLEVGLRSALPAQPRVFAMLQLLSQPVHDRAGRRLAAALDDREPHAPGFSVAAGLSSVREGVDPERLQQATGAPWLVVAAGGFTFTQLAHLLDPMLAHDVRPRVVVLGVHPSWTANASTEVLLRNPGGWASTSTAFARAAWSLHHAGSISSLAREWMRRARVGVLPALGVSARELYPPGPSEEPWAGQWKYAGARAGAGHLRDQMDGWRERGWFVDETFDATGVEARTFARLLEELHAREVRTLVVLMPGSESWRQRRAPAARQTLDAILEGRVDPADVLDLETLLPDAQMWDHSHANEAGRARVTDRIARFVARRSAVTSPQ